MNFCIWNSRGTGAISFPRLIKDLTNIYKLDFLAIVETRQSGVKADKIIKKLGFSNHEKTEAEGYTGGIWCMWNINKIQVTTIMKHRQFIHMRIEDHKKSEWYLTVVYGSPRKNERAELWNYLTAIGNCTSGAWCVAGDFNAFMFDHEKEGGSDKGSKPEREFLNWFNTFSLIDLGFAGSKWTWNNKNVKTRIDRAVANVTWRSMFEDVSVVHLANFKSDHTPLWIRTKPQENESRRNRPFRFLAPWIFHHDFPRVVKEAWKNKTFWLDGLDKFHIEIKKWNNEVFGNVFRRKKRIIARLNGIKKKLVEEYSEHLVKLQKDLWTEYEHILVEEELIWKQKSRCQWLKYGDKNSRYFHTTTLVRRRRNKIQALKDDTNNWVYEEDKLQNIAVNFFRVLYKDETDTFSPLGTYGRFPNIDMQDLDQLTGQFKQDEIRKAIFSMGSLKAPGPDGLNPLFFQNQWDNIKDTVSTTIEDIYNDPANIAKLNKTFIVLIPKIDNPTNIREFRPISLCNVSYKIITKILASRLKSIMGNVISPNQSSFVPGRSTSDNIIVAQEVIHSMRLMRGRKGYMAIKIDLEKAYDRIKWEFVRESMEDLGLPEKFIDLCWACISSPTMQLLWNGEVTESFNPSRGIRQGDPISPYLFVICMERLAHRIQADIDGRK